MDGGSDDVPAVMPLSLRLTCQNVAAQTWNTSSLPSPTWTPLHLYTYGHDGPEIRVRSLRPAVRSASPGTPPAWNDTAFAASALGG